MCIATVYTDVKGIVTEVMRDVVSIEAENNQFRITSMFGEEKYVEGILKRVDFWKDHSAVIEQSQ